MPLSNFPFKAATSGSYSGDDIVNRAITHGLNKIPAAVLIYDDTGRWQGAVIRGYNATMSHYLPATAGSGWGGYLAQTAMDMSSFYVGNATNYNTSMNGSGQIYKWVAIP